METILEYVKNNWVVWLFTVISALLGFFVRRLYARFREEQNVRLLHAARESEEQKIIREGVLAILHDRLYQACRFHLGNGKRGFSAQEEQYWGIRL